MKKMAVVFLCLAAVSSISAPTRAQGFTPIRINSAGGSYIDSQGRVWSADYAYSGGTAATSTNAIAKTVDDPLYRSERWGPFKYSFTVPAGSYQVTLKFAETWYSKSGQRLFNVAINGITVLANFDIVAASGGVNIAVDRTFAVNAASGTGNLQIQFVHISGQPDDPKVDAIEIIGGGTGTSTSAPAITTQPAGQSVVTGQTATFSVAATGAAPMSYQWKINGANISGATSSSYTTPGTTTADGGSKFSVLVSNSAGSVTSSSATLTVSTAIRLLSANPTSLSFGNVNLGSSSLLSSTLTNIGNSSVTIAGVSVSGAGLNLSGVFAGQVLLPGGSTILHVTLVPSAIGLLTGSAVVTSNSGNSPTTISLVGTGVQLISRSATLQWIASTSSSVAGYNVYSSTETGGPYTKLTALPATDSNYQDASVQSGRTYYYVVTAVNSSSVESVYSNQVTAVIP